MPDITFTPRTYFVNAQESLQRAVNLHNESRDYFAAHYFAGIAIEAILRAQQLDTYIHATRLDRVRGDRIKYSSNRLLELANEIVGLGVQKWTRR